MSRRCTAERKSMKPRVRKCGQSWKHTAVNHTGGRSESFWIHFPLESGLGTHGREESPGLSGLLHWHCFAFSYCLRYFTHSCSFSLRYRGQLRQERKIHSQKNPMTLLLIVFLVCARLQSFIQKQHWAAPVSSNVLGLGGGRGKLCSYKCVASSLSAGNLQETRKTLFGSYFPLSSNFKTTLKDAARYKWLNVLRVIQSRKVQLQKTGQSLQRSKMETQSERWGDTISLGRIRWQWR